jgi:hypothetical protein
MRNLSKNTLKRLMRPFKCSSAGGAHRYSNYFFYNEVGAQAYRQSKGAICNRMGNGAEKYMTEGQKAAWIKSFN